MCYECFKKSTASKHMTAGDVLTRQLLIAGPIAIGLLSANPMAMVASPFVSIVLTQIHRERVFSRWLKKAIDTQ